MFAGEGSEFEFLDNYRMELDEDEELDSGPDDEPKKGKRERPAFHFIKPEDEQFNRQSQLFIYRDLNDAVDEAMFNESKIEIPQPEFFAFLTGKGICHGKFYLDSQKMLNEKNISVLEYTKVEYPIAFAATRYHMIYLFNDRLRILLQPGELRCNEKSDESDLSSIVFEDRWDERSDFKGMVRDPVKGDVYLFREKDVFKVNIHDPTLGMWKIYLDRAMNPDEDTSEYFQKALELCDENEVNRDRVRSAEGDFLFELGK